MATMVGQQLLTNFYESLKFSHPLLAWEMSEDVVAVGIWALRDDKGPGQEAATRLLRVALDLPPILYNSLSNALKELGYE